MQLVINTGEINLSSNQRMESKMRHYFISFKLALIRKSSLWQPEIEVKMTHKPFWCFKIKTIPLSSNLVEDKCQSL